MKIKMFIAVALSLMMSTTVSAQFVQSGNRTNAIGSEVCPSYSRIYASYSPVTMSYDGESADDSFMGFQIGWLSGKNIASNVPVYIEYGVNVQGNFYSEDDNYDDYNYTFVSLNMPVNISYRYAIPNSKVVIAPYAGLRLKGNIIASRSWKDRYEHGSNSLFDKKYGNANRVQLGYQVGVGATFTSFYLGVGYAGDLSDFMKKTKFSGFMATVGIDF